MKNKFITLLAVIIFGLGFNSNLYAFSNDSGGSSSSQKSTQKNTKKNTKKTDKYSKIKKGMSKDQVRDILGDPDQDNDGSWYYVTNKSDQYIKDNVSTAANRVVGSLLGPFGSFVAAPAAIATQDGTSSALKNKHTGMLIYFSNGKVSKISKTSSKK